MLTEAISFSRLKDELHCSFKMLKIYAKVVVGAGDLQMCRSQILLSSLSLCVISQGIRTQT